MNILYHHRTMGRGAEGAHIAHIVKAFEAAGHKVTIASPPGVDPLKRIGASPLDKSDEKTSGITNIWKMISRHAPQIFFEFLEISYNFQAIPRLKKLIRQHDIDCIYERSAFFLYAGAYVARKKKIPLLVEANEAVGIERARKLLLHKIAFFCERYTLRHSKATFTVSSYLAKMLRSNAPSGAQVIVLPNAIDPEKFSRPTARKQIRTQFKLKDNVVIGFAGWFDWWDRLDLLIELQNRLNNNGYENVKTMLIGHGSMADDLKQQISDYGLGKKVIMTGAVNKTEVLDYIDALDIGVLAHSNEFGSPMVLFEMMALGKCVVAPDVVPVTDVVVDGKNGIIFLKLNKEQLYMKIVGLLEDKEYRETIGQKAKELILKNNTWQKNAEQILRTVSGTTEDLQV